MDLSCEKMGIWPQKTWFLVFFGSMPFFFVDIVLPLQEVFNLAGQNVGIWPQKQKILLWSQMPSFFQAICLISLWGHTESLDKLTYWKENEHCH